MKELINAINRKLKSYLIGDNIITQAMSYSLFNGGKRIRPILLIEFYKLYNDDINDCLPFACALEMIHTYSLIHDDLPCMDNDEIRRGKASSHIKYGENIALLAGDALLNKAYEIMLGSGGMVKIRAEKALKTASVLANAAGSDGMILGQTIDLQSEGKKINKKTLNTIYSKKTGELIKAATSMGCILGDGCDEEIKNAENYGKNIGFAFQIVDDILDINSNEQVLGKPIGSDLKNNKKTFVTIYGEERAREEVDKLTESAIGNLSIFKKDTSFLKELALSLKNRNK